MAQTTATIESYREGAEVYHGDDLCRQKSVELMVELGLPRGLLPLKDVEEVGFNREAGFVWLRQKRTLTHTFRKIGRLVSYASEVTAFVGERRLRRVTGVKSKELLIWVTLTDLFIDERDPTKITFRTPMGLSRSFPISAFDLDDAANAAFEAAVAAEKKNEEAVAVGSVPNANTEGGLA